MIRKFNAIKAFKLFRLFSSRVFDGMKIDSCSIALFTSNSTNQTRWWRLLRLNNMDFVVERKISGCNESALYFYAYKHKNKLPISPSLQLESEVFSRFFFVQSSDDFFYSLKCFARKHFLVICFRVFFAPARITKNCLFNKMLPMSEWRCQAMFANNFHEAYTEKKKLLHGGQR